MLCAGNGCDPGCYKFTRYKTGKLDQKSSKDAVSPEGQKAGGAAAEPVGGDAKPVLLTPPGSNVSLVMAMAEAIYWVRAWGKCRED